jgi:HAMP domain-containing protein
METLGIIPKRYPLKLTLYILLLVFSGALISFLLIYQSGNILVGKTYTEGIRNLSVMKGVIIQKSIIIYLLSSIFVISGVIIITIFYSHRVAGPLYRLSVAAKEISEGLPASPVRLRKSDVVHPLADTLNELADVYSQRLSKIMEATASLEKASLGLQEALNQKDDASFYALMDELSRQNEELKRIVNKLRL